MATVGAIGESTGGHACQFAGIGGQYQLVSDRMGAIGSQVLLRFFLGVGAVGFLARGLLCQSVSAWVGVCDWFVLLKQETALVGGSC